MDTIILFGVGVSTGLSGAMIPGPLFLFTVSEAFRQGHWAGLKIALGHLLLEALFVGLIVLGFRDWLTSSAFRQTVAWVGGVSLVVMGWLILRTIPSLSLVRQSSVDFSWGSLAGGAFFSAVSPGFLLWWGTIGAAVLLQGLLKGTAGLASVSAGHALADIVWYWLVAWSVEQGRDYCTDRAYRGIMTALAFFLIVLGIGLPVTHALKGGLG